MFPQIYSSLFAAYERYHPDIGEEVIVADFGSERLLGVPSREGTYVYLLDGLEIEFLHMVSLESCAHLWQLNCNAEGPQGRRARVIWTNKDTGHYDHHWGLRFEGNHEILLRALQVGQKARVLSLPSGYKK